MSVIVRGIDVPKSCLECTLCNHYDNRCFVGFKVENDMYFHNRNEDCPLISVNDVEKRIQERCKKFVDEYKNTSDVVDLSADICRIIERGE